MDSIRVEQIRVLELSRQGLTQKEIAQQMGLSVDQVFRRINSARKQERLDPELSRRLADAGVKDLAGLHSGWLIDKDEDGAGQSLYFYLGPDEEKLNFIDALQDVLTHITVLPPLARLPDGEEGKDLANWLMLADLHVGTHYGDPELESDFNHVLDDLVSRLPKAEKAVLFELGDLLDANDHKGVTPASGNNCDVRRDSHLANTRAAIRMLRRAIIRLAETHQEVEVHMLPGNHDPTAYMAVMLAIDAHFADNPRINIFIPETELEEDFRVVAWGQCACFPHHGHTASWNELKDVWTDQFAPEWAASPAFRLIATAHFHHDRKRDLVGVTGEHYRTLATPNKWARSKGLFSRGSLTALTVHKHRGEEFRTISNVKRKTLRD